MLKNQEGQCPLEVATGEDVRCLLQDAMAAVPTSTTATSVAVTAQINGATSIPATATADSAGTNATTAPPTSPAPPASPIQSAPTVHTDTVVLPSGACLSLPSPTYYHKGDGATSPHLSSEARRDVAATTLASFLQS